MDRGDIWFVDLDPTRGHEQAKARPVMIVSPQVFNMLGVQLIAPISSGGAFVRMRGFAVPLPEGNMKTKGVVLCHQIRTVDLQARHGRFVEKAPDAVVDDVLARLQTLFEY